MAAKNVNRCLRLGVWPALVLIATLCGAAVRAQDNAAQAPPRAVNSTASPSPVVSVNEPFKVWIGVRGCLRKGDQPNSYFMTGVDGKTWELLDRHSRLRRHVGQKLDLTGYEVHNPNAKGDKADAKQNTVDNGQRYAGVHVTKFATTGETCGK